MKTDKNHIAVLDALRAIAALSVCLYHFVCTTTNFITTDFVIKFFHVGKYGVHMFFVISGFVIPWSLYQNKYKPGYYFNFIVKRFIRLEPPYLVALLVAILISFSRTYLSTYNGIDVKPGTKQILLHFGYLIPFFKDQKWINQVFWTLAIEFQYYIGMGLFYFVIVHRYKLVRITGYLFMLWLPFLTGQGFFPYWASVFLLGMLLFLYKINKIGYLEFLIVASLALIETYFLIDAYSFAVSLFTTAVIFYLDWFTHPWLEFLGKISYSVYLLHAIIGSAFVNICSHYVTSGWLKPVIIVAGVGCSLGSAYLLYWFVERPSKQLSSRIRLSGKFLELKKIST